MPLTGTPKVAATPADNNRRIMVDMDLPLTGVKVADFTGALAGPLATMCLADLGADVVKIEDADRGEMARDTAPWIFVALNRNERSIGIDLRTDDGRALGRQLALSSDIVVSSFRPGVMASFGLGAEDLMAEKPSLIYARLSGYGEHGPKAHRRGLDLTIRAESGLVASGNTVTPGIALVDYLAGATFAQALLAALIRRDRTGKGSVIDERLLDAGVFLQGVRLAEHSATGRAEVSPPPPTTGIFDTADGKMAVAVYYDRDWARLCEGIGRPDAAADERFSTRPRRAEHFDEVRQLVTEALRTKTRAEWCEILDGLGVMVGSVLETDELPTDPQLAHNEVFVDAPAAGGPAVRLVRLPYTFDGAGLPIRSPAPVLNRDGAEILTDLGFDDDAIADLAARGIITNR